MKTVTVASSIDDSTKLQKLIDSIGNTPSKLIFSEYNDIEISSLLRIYDYSEWSGNETKFHLKDNAPDFGSQVPIIGAKNSSITGLTIEGIIYDGNYANQGNTSGDHGLGYGNLFGFSNITKSTFKKVQVNKNEGDGWRISGGSDLTFSECSGYDGGHDFIHLYNVDGATIRGGTVEIRSNNAIRVRSSSDVLIDGCTYTDYNANAWAPPVQLEKIITGSKCEKIEIKNCRMQNIKGPGVWGIATVPLGDAAEVNIHNNIFKNCGLMESGNGIDGVGGIVLDGFTNVQIQNNIFDSCQGNAINFDNYIGKGNVKGCTATIKRNIIVNTKKANYPGPVSGYGIANVLGNYTIESSENCFWNNVSDPYYNVEGSSDILADPLFTADYHLQTDSPCRFSGYQIGAYSDPEETPTELLISCSEEDVETISKSITYEHEIYRRIE